MLVLVIALLATGNVLASGSGVLCGTVRDSATNEPIADAFVTVASLQGDQSVKTDQAGRFAFINLVFGRYVLTVSKKGYDRTSIGVDVVGDVGATVVAIAMSKPLRTIVMVRDWPPLVNPYETADVYIPPWSHYYVNPFNSAFQLLWMVPGLTFGSAPRMMR